VRARAEIVCDIAPPLDLTEATDRIVSVVLRIFNARRAALFEIDATSGDLVCVAVAGDLMADEWIGRTVARGIGAVGRAFAEGRPVWASDVSAADPPIVLPDWIARLVGKEPYSAVAAPLVVNGKTIGALGVAAERGRECTAHELEMLCALAEHAALAFQHARLYRDQEVRATRISTLSRLNQLISWSLDADTTLVAITKAAATLMDARHSAIWLADEAAGVIEARAMSSSSYPKTRLRFGEGLTGWAAQHRAVVNVADVAADPRTAMREWFTDVAARSLLAIPIIFEKTQLGILTLVGVRPFVLDADTRELLESFVAQSAVAIRNAQLYDEAQQRRRQAETLAGLTGTIVANLDLDTVLQQTVEAARDLVKSDRAQIALRDPDADIMVMRYGAPDQLGGTLQGLRIEKGKGLGGLAWARRRPVRTDNQVEDQALSRDYDHIVRAEGLGAVLAVPIVIGNDVEGLLYVDNAAPRGFGEHDETVLTALAVHAAVAIQNAWLFEHARAANDRLAVLSRRLIEVEEDERRHLARELHDGLGQELAVLGLELAQLAPGSDRRQAEALESSLRIVDRLMEHVRNRSLDLHPSVLDDLGLVAALDWYVERQARGSGVRAVVAATPPNLRWPAAIETVCFRVAQEALRNAIKHGRPRRVRVELRESRARLILSVRDDGAGFDVAHARRNASQGRSLGVLAMQERVQLAGGELRIESSPGGGTLVQASFPNASV
jgi:signal transduction histidine kinase